MKYIERHINDILRVALNVSPAIFLNGPRQTGKSTLAQNLARVQKRTKAWYPDVNYVTFDRATEMSAAARSPESYLTEKLGEGALIIDEVQQVPEIFRALKIVIDQRRFQHNDNPKCRFLLTGSSNIMALPKLSEPLVGRMSTITLYPFSGAEVLDKVVAPRPKTLKYNEQVRLPVERPYKAEAVWSPFKLYVSEETEEYQKGDFLQQAFGNDFNMAQFGRECTLNYVMHRATFPEISGKSTKARELWFDGYINAILQRDVRALAEIEKLSTLPNLLRVLASRAGGLINDADIARSAGLVHGTARNYKTLLKMLFLTFEVPPWYRNIGKRLVKAPKGYLIDTLLLCHLLEYELTEIEKRNPELFGHVVENYVATELLKLISNCATKVTMSHFRTSDGKEVDFVLERRNGQLVGIEVKNRDSVSTADFKGLQVLRSLTKKDFVCGVVLYRGKEVVPFADNLWAIPISRLWSRTPPIAQARRPRVAKRSRKRVK